MTFINVYIPYTHKGWVLEMIDNLDELINRIVTARRNKEVTSIGFHGNVVSVWERLVEEYQQTGELLGNVTSLLSQLFNYCNQRLLAAIVDLASDQTSCHNPFSGG